MINPPSTKQTRAVALRNYFSPFGNKLVETGYASSEQMQQALVETRKTGRSLPDVLEGLTGRQLPAELVRQYKKHQLFELKILFGIDSVDPEVSPVATREMGELIATMIPIELCLRYKVLPLSRQNSDPPSVLVAMVDPDNLDAQDVLNRILRAKNVGFRRMVITQSDFDQLLEQYQSVQVSLAQERDRDKKAEELSNLKDLTEILGTVEMSFSEAGDGILGSSLLKFEE
jgi:type IV pilus assembly protein PilB